jgi:hypothetical protein
MKHLLTIMMITLLVAGVTACTKSEPPADADTVDADAAESIVQPEEVYEDRAAEDITDANADEALDNIMDEMARETD